MFIFRNIANFVLQQNIKQRTSMKLDPTSSKPLHLQAEEVIRDLIKSDEYKNGKLLPNEVELSKQLNISRNTLRTAINQLVVEGLLVRKKGHGTRVVQKAITGGVKNWLSFSQEMKMLGINVHNFELRVAYETPDDAVREFFRMDAGDTRKCLLLERVRGKEEYPFVYFISYFNPDIPFRGVDDFTKPLYSILEYTYNIVVKTSKEEVSASLAGDAIARKLDIQPSDPILIRKRMVFDTDGKPVEYNIGYYRADSFTYTIEATR